MKLLTQNMRNQIRTQNLNTKKERKIPFQKLKTAAKRYSNAENKRRNDYINTNI